MRSQDAITFLVAKLEEQARLDGVLMSDVERRMLRWSEVEPDGVHDLALNEQFASDCDTDEYEAKIALLLSRARDRDSRDPIQKSRWRDAKAALKGHDYYLMVMLDQMT